MSHLEARIALQRSRFSLIENAADFGESEGSGLSRQLVVTRMDMLEQNWMKFQEEHVNMCLTENEALSEQPYLKERVYERCHAFYVYSRAKLLTQRDEFDTLDRHSRSSLSDHVAAPSSLPRSALPRIKLPSFAGDYNTWRAFHDLFTSLIKENADLTSVEKLHYLKTCLTGEAARLICNLPASGDNFTVAWSLLLSRYENKRSLITTQLDRITSLKPLKTKSAQGLRTLHTTLSEALGAMRALGCAVHQWDPLLLHLIVKLLDPETREAWEVQLGSSPTYPTYAQFEEFLIGRTRAMENLGQQAITTGSHKAHSIESAGKPRPRVTAYAATSSSDTGSCPLCESAHYLAKCDRYSAKTVQQRRDVILKHKRCFNCLGPHSASKCHSTRRCQKCGKKHHTTIHDGSSASSTKHTTEGKTKTDNAQSSAQPQNPPLTQ
ncbi:PREDICTED: uncharacterized protein LOC105556698 [Vollenhovia emeryi]|uniref:uncharacterized protein LOC105556698 n=1 Tax=Vollenhovia emeryi TaxID=411798 RepID=UPI0005F4D30F|nr:PREDICTED: uncharacterized protein LOC105556698 [Vollenhovia emeryi]